MNDMVAMIVDDSEADRFLLRRLLRRATKPRAIYEVNNGQEAIDFLRNPPSHASQDHPPRVIFLDINMPLLDGFGFLEHYADMSLAQREPSVVIMFSSSERAEDRERALAFPFVAGFITKMPANADELRKQLEEILS